MLAHPKRWIVAIIAVFALLILAACDSSGPIAGLIIPVEQKPAPSNSAPIKLLGTAGTLPVNAVAWTSDGKIMAWGDSHGITLIDAHTLQDIRRIETQSWMKSLAFSPDGKWLAAGPAGDTYSRASSGSISVWAVATGQLARSWAAGDTGLIMGFSTDGRTLGTRSYDTVRVWDVSSGQLVHSFYDANVLGAYFKVSPDARYVWLEYLNAESKLWNLETNTQVFTSDKRATQVAFSPDSRRMAIAWSDPTDTTDTIDIVDVHRGQIERTFRGLWYSNCLAFSSDGKQLVVGGGDDEVQLWDIEAGRLRHTLPGQKYFYQFAFSPDGTRLAVAAGDRLRWWDTQTGQLLQTVEALAADRIFYSPDGRFLVDQNDMALRLWDAATGQLLRAFDNGPLAELVFTADDRLLMLKPAATTLWQWDPAAQQFKLQNTLPGSGSTLLQSHRQTAISPDGRILAVLSLTSTIQLIDTQSGQTLHMLKGHIGSIIDLKFSLDGAQLISSGDLPQFTSGPARNGELRVWDVRSGQLLSVHETTPWLVYADGQPSAQTWLATRHQPGDSCSRSGVHDMALYSMEELLSDRAEVSPRWANSLGPFDWVTLSADGRVSAVANRSVSCGAASGPVQVWNAQTGALLAHVSLNEPAGRPVLVTSLTLNPGGSVLAIGADDGSLTMWDVNNGQRLHSLSGLTSNSNRLIFTPDGQLLISGNQNGQVQVWEARSGQLLQTLSGHTAEVTHLLSGHQGRFLISGSDDGTARLWDLGEDHPSAPVSAPFTSTYHTVSLATLANAATIFDPSLTGSVKWNGVPFELAQRIFKTQAAPAPDSAYPVTGTLAVNIPAAARLYVLLNTGNGFVKFKDKTIGQIAVTCKRSTPGRERFAAGPEYS